ncbi:hypothetical protein pb186bvf_015742 [Paramecium bursaria]
MNQTYKQIFQVWDFRSNSLLDAKSKINLIDYFLVSRKKTNHMKRRKDIGINHELLLSVLNSSISQKDLRFQGKIYCVMQIENYLICQRFQLKDHQKEFKIISIQFLIFTKFQIQNEKNIQYLLQIIIMYNIDSTKIIGSGQFGIIYESTDLQNNEKVCAKVITSDYLKQSLQNELDIMDHLKKQKHPNIVSILGVDQVEEDSQFKTIIYMEYCKDGNLQQELDKNFAIFNLDYVLTIMKQIIKGIKFLQENLIIHRDLKPANILLDQGVFKITDFGTSRFIENNQFILKSRTGSPAYASPQIIDYQQYTLKTDIYSLGIIFYQLVFNKFPFGDKVSYYTIQDFQQRIKLKPFECPEINMEGKVKDKQKIRQLINRMVQYNESDRLDSNEIFLDDQEDNLSFLNSVIKIQIVQNQPQYSQFQEDFLKIDQVLASNADLGTLNSNYTVQDQQLIYINIQDSVSTNISDNFDFGVEEQKKKILQQDKLFISERSIIIINSELKKSQQKNSYQFEADLLKSTKIYQDSQNVKKIQRINFISEYDNVFINKFTQQGLKIGTKIRILNLTKVQKIGHVIKMIIAKSDQSQKISYIVKNLDLNDNNQLQIKGLVVALNGYSINLLLTASGLAFDKKELLQSLFRVYQEKDVTIAINEFQQDQTSNEQLKKQLKNKINELKDKFNLDYDQFQKLIECHPQNRLVGLHKFSSQGTINTGIHGYYSIYIRWIYHIFSQLPSLKESKIKILNDPKYTQKYQLQSKLQKILDNLIDLESKYAFENIYHSLPSEIGE